MRNILSFADIPAREVYPMLEHALELKAAIKAGKRLGLLDNKIVGLLFEKPSTRTRTSFEAAIIRLGGSALYLPGAELQLKRGEPVKDTARVLGGYLDALVARVFADDTVAQLARYSRLPTINGLSDIEHPTQLISDMLTVYETKKRLKGLNIAYIGDGDNVANSLLLAAAAVGANATVACPKGYEPNGEILAKARATARKTGARIAIVREPGKAARNADVLYTDVWVSMGEESETEERMRAFKGYQINSGLLRLSKRDAIVMHCLPAHRGLEITDAVLEGRQSVVWRQAENKLYGAAAALDFAINDWTPGK
jgi:ornithine carbamoyltransferase